METLPFDGNVVTPSGTPLGGWVHVEVSNNGDFYVKFHMHSSSMFGNFDFNLRAYLTAPGFPTMAFIQSGHVSGVDDWDHEERGNNPLLALYWSQLKASATYSVAKDYKWGGVVGTIEDLVRDILDIGAAVVGGALGVIIGATREAIGWLGSRLGPGGTLGVIGGVVVFAVAIVAGEVIGGALILGVVAGVAIGAVTNAMIKSRPLNDAEIAVARQVFGDTLPYDKVIITNLGGLGGRAFTAPGVDGKTYCNLGSSYDNPLGPREPFYPYPAQLLIHELTHAWQIAHTGFIPGLMCSGIVNQADKTILGDNVYAYGPPGPDWSRDFNQEQQGAIVDQWFGGNFNSAGYLPMDQENIYYRYISDNILGGRSARFAPANLRTSPAFAVARTPNHLDLFWLGRDGAVASHWWDAALGANWGDHAPFPITPAGAAQDGSPVVAVTRMPNHLDVFWVGKDGAIASQWWDAAPKASWGDHAPFPITPPGAAQAGSQVAAVARTTNHLDVFWVGPDGAIGTQWWDVTPGMSWGDHGPFPITPPGAAQPGSAVVAVARTPNHLDVFWVGPDGAIASHWWDAAPGAGWADHGPFPITPPGAAQPGSRLAVVARTPNHLDVFWEGPDGAIGTQWWDGAPGMGWGDHRPFPISPPGAAQPGSPIAAVARTPNHIDVFWVGPDGAIGSQWWDGAPGASWGDHAPFPITPPGASMARSRLSAVARTPGHLDVFWVGPDGAIGTQWWDEAPGMSWGDHGPFPVTPPGAAQA
jgi:hypothetical protein